MVVGTPGRVCDLVDRGVLSLHAIESCVLDEADHMLDIGYEAVLCWQRQRNHVHVVGSAAVREGLLLLQNIVVVSPT